MPTKTTKASQPKQYPQFRIVDITPKYDPTAQLFATLHGIPNFSQGDVWDFERLARHIFSLKGLADKLVNDCADSYAKSSAEFFRFHVQKYLSAINGDDIPSKSTFDELSHNMTQSLLSVYIIYALSGNI